MERPRQFRPGPASLKLPPHFPDLPGVREQLPDYCSEVNRVDRTVGTVLAELKKRNLMDSTIIVFCGDNGMAMPHGKSSLYDPGTNVPFVLRWSGVVKLGGDSRALISGEDLAPTLLDAAGLAPWLQNEWRLCLRNALFDATALFRLPHDFSLNWQRQRA